MAKYAASLLAWYKSRCQNLNNIHNSTMFCPEYVALVYLLQDNVIIIISLIMPLVCSQLPHINPLLGKEKSKLAEIRELPFSLSSFSDPQYRLAFPSLGYPDSQFVK